MNIEGKAIFALLGNIVDVYVTEHKITCHKMQKKHIR